MPLGSGLYQNFIKHYEERKNLYIIDAHSHFGKDNFWPNYGDLNEYIKCNNYIKETFAMSVPCPVLYNSDGTKTILSYYETEGRVFKHYRVEQVDNKKIYKLNLSGVNPYKEANDYIYNLCKSNNSIKFNYVPLIHPYFYSYDDIIENVKKGAKMFKIHGVACGVMPEKINSDFFRIIEELKIPIIIHTDFSKEENILSYNKTINWLKILRDYDINVYFTHGTRLSENSIDIINSDDRYMIGIGPDKILNSDALNEHKINDYLKYCFFRIDIDKLIFDIDYPWNIKKNDDYTYDWDTLYRLEKLNLSFEEKDKVLSKNIKKFIEKRR